MQEIFDRNPFDLIVDRSRIETKTVKAGLSGALQFLQPLETTVPTLRTDDSMLSDCLSSVGRTQSFSH